MCKIHLATIMISTHNILFFVSVLISSTITRGEVVSESNTTTVSSVPEYANYGEPCTKITDCDASAYHTCVNGSCLCALTEAMKFDDASSSCWVLPGQKCVYRASEVGLSLMVDAAIGEERTIRGDRISFRCVSNSACEDGFCVCDAGYFPTQNGTCEKQREHGELCKSDAECRSSLHLICNETSQCACNQDSSFDLEHGLCVGLGGSSCFDFELCTENAYCPSFGIFNQYDVKCTCKPGFFETANRTCDEKLAYGATCANHQECRDDINLICLENKCSCNTTSHLYDAAAEGKCLSLVGSSCSEQSACVPNAECQHAGFLNGNVLARNMLCRCAYGFFENGDKVCEKKREFDVECKEDNQCRDDLKLICNKGTGLCACNDTIHTYDRSKRRCISRAGFFCERNEQCVINSICRSPGYLYPRHSPRAECICRDGFSKTKEGFCLGKYGSKCESWTNSCADGLICRSGECSCKFGNHQQYYDYMTERCATYVGAPCGGANDTSCIPNAACGPDSVCRCNEGFVATEGGKRCVALVGQKCSEGELGYSYGGGCTPHAICDASGYCRCAMDFYTTVNSTCDRKKNYGELCSDSDQCQDAYCEIMGSFCSCNKSTSHFDSTRKKCMRLAGAKCYDMRDCVPNALCRSPGRLNPVDTDATCTCKEGYYTTSNGTCEWKRGYGETCTESKQCQDASDLICSVHGRCECNSTISVFDETRMTCVRLAGASCSNQQQCVAHAKCKNPLYWIHYESFSPNAKCECEEELGYTNANDGTCIIDYYGGKCDIGLGQLCSKKFSCVDGRCLCQYEDHQKYDYKTKSCISLIKGPCDNTSNLCVKNAHCLVTEEGISECRCKHGFIAVNRGCELTFGQACSVRSKKAIRAGRIYISDGTASATGGDGIAENEEPLCDRIAPLKCIHGTCQCGGFQFYDYENQKCRGLVGSRCEPEVKGFCTEGSLCEAYRSLPPAGSLEAGSNNTTKKRYGRCKCMQGYAAETNRTCTRLM